MTRFLYLDASAGVSGDMFVGALIDAGASINLVREHIRALGVDGMDVRVRKVRRGGTLATKFDVLDPLTGNPVDALPPDREVKGGHVHHRGLHEIAGIITASSLPEQIKENAIGVFRILAEAEAKVHGTTLDQVHFHEVGALDSIADIVGGVSALYQLQVDEIWCSPIHVGSGTVRCAHGLLPVPAPATRELLRAIPHYSTAIQGELATPTGVALLKKFCVRFRPMPMMTIDRIGHGAGSKDFGIPNVLKARLGELPLHLTHRKLMEHHLFL